MSAKCQPVYSKVIKVFKYQVFIASHFQRLGKAISLSVERFVTVGETIGEEAGCLVRGVKETDRRPGHSQLQDGQARKDMLEACRESRHVGNMVEKLSESLAAQVTLYSFVVLATFSCNIFLI